MDEQILKSAAAMSQSCLQTLYQAATQGGPLRACAAEAARRREESDVPSSPERDMVFTTTVEAMADFRRGGYDKREFARFLAGYGDSPAAETNTEFINAIITGFMSGQIYNNDAAVIA